MRFLELQIKRQNCVKEGDTFCHFQALCLLGIWEGSPLSSLSTSLRKEMRSLQCDGGKTGGVEYRGISSLNRQQNSFAQLDFLSANTPQIYLHLSRFNRNSSSKVM